jgi:hypothetical protein
MIDKKIILTVSQKRFLAWVYININDISNDNVWGSLIRRVVKKEYYMESDVDSLNTLRELTQERYKKNKGIF